MRQRVYEYALPRTLRRRRPVRLPPLRRAVCETIIIRYYYHYYYYYYCYYVSLRTVYATFVYGYPEIDTSPRLLDSVQ